MPAVSTSRILTQILTVKYRGVDEWVRNSPVGRRVTTSYHQILVYGKEASLYRHVRVRVNASRYLDLVPRQCLCGRPLE